jgi:hypothetical protein
MGLEYHPAFSEWLAKLAAADEAIAGEISALLALLEEHGFDLGEPEAKPVLTSPSRLWELRADATDRRDPRRRRTPSHTSPLRIRHHPERPSRCRLVRRGQI